MNKKNHIHLIGICGTAMASLAGMLKQRGFRVTGSDAAAYPPMSDFLRELGIPVAQPFAAQNLDPSRIWSCRQRHVPRQRGTGGGARPAYFHSVLCRSCCTTNSFAARKCWSSPELMARPRRRPMLAWIFDSTGLQPSFLIGGIAENFGLELSSRRWQALHRGRR